MTNIEMLLAVQEYDIRIAEIDRELRDVPKRKDEELTRLDKHKESLEETNGALKAKQAEIGQLELEVESAKEKISKFRKQQLEIKTNKEFKAMEHEIKAVKDQILGLEDKELVLMEELEIIRSDVAQKQRDLTEEEKEVAADVEMLDGRAAGLDAERAQVAEKRGGAAGEISEREWLERYDRIREKRLNAVVKLEDGICSGCHMQLPPSAVHDVHKPDTITSCDYCGRLLY